MESTTLFDRVEKKMEDDSEEVIYEFDLNASTSKCDLFTFSSKDYPFDTDQSNTTVASVKVKPTSKQFEISLNFNKTDSLSKSKNSELLLVNEKKLSLTSEDRLMKMKILKSNYLPESRIKYGVCYLNNTKKVIDIVPIDRVFDFQTDFNYMDSKDQKEYKDQSIDTQNQSDEALIKLSNRSVSKSADPLNFDSPIELRNFTLRYEDTFEYSPWSHVNYNDLKEKTNSEAWKQLEIISKSKGAKNFGRKKVAFCDELSAASKSARNSDRYCLLPRKIVDGKANSDSNSISLARINQLQLNERINRLLINCVVIPYDKLVSLVASSLDEDVIVKILLKSAMLVQGNWVVKSEILHPSSSYEMGIIHDFVSFCFTKSKELKREQIQDQIKFPLDPLMSVLTRLAQFDNQTRTWHFLYPTDDKFIRNHENINLQMKISWEIKGLQIFKSILNYGADQDKSKRKTKPKLLKKSNDFHKTTKKRLRKRKG